MPRGGQPKGERRGGRVVGVPNRATIERAEIARLEMASAKAAKKKMAKDRLEEIMDMAAGIAVRYAPFRNQRDENGGVKRDDAGRPLLEDNPGMDMAEFKDFLRLWLDATKALAPYQSPQLRAIMIEPPAPEHNGGDEEVITLSIFDSEGNKLRDGQMFLPKGKASGHG